MTDPQIRPSESWAAGEYVFVEENRAPLAGSFVRWAHRAPGDRWDSLGAARVTVPSSAVRLVPLLSVMLSWEMKPDNWFGGEARPSFLTMQSALDLLTINHFTGPLPYVRPTTSGGVQFEWTTGEAELEIEALPDGRVVIMIDNGEEIVTDEVDDPRNSQIKHLLELAQR